MYGINIFIDNLTIVILFQMCNNLHDLYNYHLENYCEYMKHTENIYVYIYMWTCVSENLRFELFK